MMHNYRSHTCADLKIEDVGSNVRLSGWVHRVRDHGGVLFIDLRDHYGVTQVLCDPDSPVFSQVENVRSEWCVRIDGEVKARDPELINTKISTGGIEVFIRDIEVLGASAELPLMVFGDQEYPEETRLRYRYLDLRREVMQENIITCRCNCFYPSENVGYWFQGVSNANYHSFITRRCKRFFSSFSSARRKVLCAPTSSTAIQTINYGIWI